MAIIIPPNQRQVPLDFLELQRASFSRALHHKQDHIAYELVERGADLNSKGVLRERPLLIALMCRHKAMMRFLVAHGSDITSKDQQNSPPLRSVLYSLNAQVDKLEMFEILLNVPTRDVIAQLDPHVETTWHLPRNLVHIVLDYTSLNIIKRIQDVSSALAAKECDGLNIIEEVRVRDMNSEIILFLENKNAEITELLNFIKNRGV